MEEKVGFFKTVAGMFKGLVRPSEYIKTGRKSSWFAIHVLVICVSILLPMVVFYIPVSKKIGYNRLADAIDDRIISKVIKEIKSIKDADFEFIARILIKEADIKSMR